MPKKIDLGNHVLGGKLNLVTKIDRNGSYDEYPCVNCGRKFRNYGISRSKTYPGPCYVSKARSLEVAEQRRQEQVENLVVLGAWGSPAIEHQCPKCKGVMILCPKEGHPNSKYWSLQRDDGAELFVCPNNCPED